MTSINPQRFGACFDRGRNLPLRVLALIGLIVIALSAFVIYFSTSPR